ncbi:centromere protein C [Saccopteryx bilineata]|uniref:centromere protein C n=1 Tax=Saccopteryx bilineata TaxID=59482 RepID=UPI0033901CEA
MRRAGLREEGGGGLTEGGTVGGYNEGPASNGLPSPGLCACAAPFKLWRRPYPNVCEGWSQWEVPVSALPLARTFRAPLPPTAAPLVRRLAASCGRCQGCASSNRVPVGAPHRLRARTAPGRSMAASGLDHLKNGYRRRFCRSPRALDINMRQGQNLMVILQDCFEDKSLASDFNIEPTKSVLYSTPKKKDTSLPSPSRECQISQSKSVPGSSRKKGTSPQFTTEPSEDGSTSVQAHEVHQETLATGVGSKNTPDSRKMSSEKVKDHHKESDEFLSVDSPSVLLDAKTSVPQNNTVSSIGQMRKTYTFEDSVNMLSSSTEISHKTKKRLDFEDKDNLKKVEIENTVSSIEDEVSEQERKPTETSQKIIQDSEYEIQPQTKKSFSTLFLETLKRKNECSPVIRHIATVPPQSSPASNGNLEDEFIIDESDSFASESWITIPRKTVPRKQRKQRTVSPAESTPALQSQTSRECHNEAPTTLTDDKHSGKAHQVEKSQPSEQRKLGKNCALTDEMENDCRSTKHERYSKNAETSSGSERTIKPKQKRKFKANVVEEQVDMEQAQDKNINVSHITQDKPQRNSARSLKACKEKRNVHTSKKQVLPVGSKKSSTNVPHTRNQAERESGKEDFSSSSKNSLEPQEVTMTVLKSHRISRCPSDWWVVKSEQSSFSSDSSVRNVLSVRHSNRRKPAEKTNQSSKNIGKKPVPFKGRKRANPCRSRAQKILNTKDSRGITDHDEVSGSPQNESLECDETDMVQKENLDHSGVKGSSEGEDSIVAMQNVHLEPQNSGHPCKTPAESDSQSGEPQTSVLEESGPCRLENLTSEKENSAMDNEEVQESLDNPRTKRSKVTQENKIHHKIVLPTNTPNVRRTKRIRLKPLEYWRGERVDYQETQSGGFVIGGILSPETVPSKRKAKGETKKVQTIVNRKRICLDNDERKKNIVLNLNISLGDPLKPTSIKDPDTGKMILMDLLRPRDRYQFLFENGELKVYKTLDTPLFSTGKLILGPHQEKGKQHVGMDTLVFYVNFGDLLCTLHETPYVITTGDSFYVPSGNYYNIKNLLNEESVLLFTQIKR